MDRLRAQTYIERKGIFGDQGIRRSARRAARNPEPGF